MASLVFMLGCVTEPHVKGGATVVWWDEGQWEVASNCDKRTQLELRWVPKLSGCCN
jgi:hypothetical protein